MERMDAKAVAEQLRADIKGGKFAPGELLPNTEHLRERFGVGKNVVSAAVQTLKGEGLLAPGGRGQPVRVRTIPQKLTRSNTNYQEEKDLVKASEEVRRRRGSAERDANVAIESVNDDPVAYEVVPAPANIAEILELGPDDYVLRRTYLRQYREGEGYSRMVSYLPYSLVKDHPLLLDSDNEPWPGGTLHQLYTAGVEVAKIEDRVSARMPTEEETALYDIPFNVPVIPILKISYDTSGRAVDVAELLAPADRISLSYTTELRKWDE
ncbi:GntR family transcriptional regulator [Amycolatopsis sp. NPDC102389]|uniref:GntR family transcriptional regulator n=1 Tax=Amycolatopsis sp. NPDC102389 TaxID=3363941 RepID=UPI00381D6000